MSGETRDMILFIDSGYNILFYLLDGENIVITRSDGARVTERCDFLDAYHFRMGGEIFHIYEFAQRMNKAGSTYAPENPPKMPEKFASVLPSTGELIFIEKGKKGYVIARFSSGNPDINRRRAIKFNHYKGITPQMEAAMLGGALKGWASPAARVSSYDVRGNPVRPSRGKSRRPREAER